MKARRRSDRLTQYRNEMRRYGIHPVLIPIRVTVGVEPALSRRLTELRTDPLAWTPREAS